MLSIQEQLFNNMLDQIKRDKTVTNETMKDLFDLFGDECFQIINTLDSEVITKITSPSKQFIFRVTRQKTLSTLEYNHCLTSGNFCTCAKFRQMVCKDNCLWCSHLAAAKIAEVLECYQLEANSQNVFEKLLMTIIL